MDACKSWYLITTQERPAQLLIAKDGFNMAEVDAEKDSAPMMSYSGLIDIHKEISIYWATRYGSGIAIQRYNELLDKLKAAIRR